MYLAMALQTLSNFQRIRRGYFPRRAPAVTMPLGQTHQYAPQTHVVHASPIGPFTLGCFAIGLLFLFPAFTFQLAFDPINFKFTSSPLLQIISASTELFALAIIFGSREISRMVRSCWPILILIAFAFVSTLWSVDRALTIRASNVFATTCLFSLALVGRLDPTESVRFVLRMMALGCVLSIVWVIFLPGIAIHQATDQSQSVHAGLWRGIFTHKQGLGVFAGLTMGLLLFYGGIAFRSPITRMVAIASAIACMAGTESTTGLLTAVITSAMLYGTYAVAKMPQNGRSAQFNTLLLLGLVLVAAFHLGVLDWVPRLLGKSSDLTGREDIWPLALENFRNSGFATLGGGYGSGLAAAIIDAPIDSGYIDKIIEFGYAGSPIIFALYIWIGLAGRRLILKTPAEQAAINVFPFCIIAVVMVINITEGLFMAKHITTVLVAVAAGMTVRNLLAPATQDLPKAG
jgi:exopolysaccharide production protein ExoQ